MNIPNDRKYSKTHEWVLFFDGKAKVGITDHAQEMLGDITFVDLPAVGSHLTPGMEAGSIESVKAASELYAPVGGEVIQVNESLETAPEKINADPYGEGWLFMAEVEKIPDDLLDSDAYKALCAHEKH